MPHIEGGPSSELDMSVIVVGYNQPRSLALTMQMLGAQTFDGSYEVIVADDGSSAGFFAEQRDAMNDSPIPFTYLWQQDRGFRAGQARNRGMDLARGRLLLFLDGDLVPDTDTLQRHAEAHTQPKMMIGSARKWCGEFNDEDYASLSVYTVAEAVRFLRELEPSPVNASREAGEREVRRRWLAGSHPARAALIGGTSFPKPEGVYFDEEYTGWGFEDLDFALRLHEQHGYTPDYRDDITLFHVETSAGVGNVFRQGDHSRIVQYCRNVFRFSDRHPDVAGDDIFFGFARFELDEATNTWRVVPRPEAGTYDPEERVAQMRRWLAANDSRDVTQS